jgi:ankyrin repeat protein
MNPVQEQSSFVFPVRGHGPVAGGVTRLVQVAIVVAGLLGPEPGAGQSTNQALLEAAAHGRPEEVQRLLSRGADVNARRSVEGSTALILASNRGSTEVVRILLDKGADVNAANMNGWTALMGAAAHGHADVAKLLLKRKADPNAKHRYGWTALKLASQKGHRAVRQLLLRHGAKR